MDVASTKLPRPPRANANRRDRARTAAGTAARRRTLARSRAESPGEIDDDLRRSAPDRVAGERYRVEFAHHALTLDTHAAAIVRIAQIFERRFEYLGHLSRAYMQREAFAHEPDNRQDHKTRVHRLVRIEKASDSYELAAYAGFLFQLAQRCIDQ